MAAPQSANNPRKHHYLPISYLRNFCSENGSLYVYERGKQPRKSNPKSEANIRDFYAYHADDGLNYEYEHALSRHESEVAPVIQGIIDRKMPNQFRLLTPEEIDILRQFVAFTFTRVPAGRRFDREHAAPATKRLMERAAQNETKFKALCKDMPISSG